MNNMDKDKNIHTPNSLVFLNTPIHDEADDILGFQSHVDALQAAIDANAQMIAITSPFGAGKSSVTELLRTQKDNQRVVNVSMWSHLCKKCDDTIGNQTIELHRSFLYQIVSNLSSKNGSYISRRLSKNYGLLKLHTENPRYYIAAFLSLMFFLLGYVLPYVLRVGIPTVWGQPEMWNGLFILISVICFVYIIVRAEIVFSSNKSEGALTIDEHELIELYRKFVLDYCTNQTKIEKFIFVIEDLDRTNDHDCVINFLKELRKYYTLENHENKRQNKIVFIVNVKPETSLFKTAKEHKAVESESLYAKLFDYVLNIQTINIDDYETVLESILQNSQDTIHAVFPDSTYLRLVDIPGMQWIIRGKDFGVRDIKDRLNRSFSLYASLRSRFPSSPIEFEKCAVVAYLTTVYEQDFIKTDDRTFGKLVEAHLQHKLSEDLCRANLGKENTEYAKEVCSLIQAKLIDSNYRMYFYNYPKNSTIYSHDEHAIQNAILYGEMVDNFEDMALRVTANNVKVVYDALDRIEKLKMPLPDTVFACEPLFIEALRHYPDGVFEWISNLDYSQNAFDKTSRKIINILSFDKERFVYKTDHATRFCEIWEEKLKENELLRFRSMLCSTFAKEILWYTPLFMGVHNIASFTELDLLSLENAIKLTNAQKDTFSVKYAQYILQRFEKEVTPVEKLINNVQAFLTSAEKKLGSSATVTYLIQFMQHLRTIIPEYEVSVMSQLTSNRVDPEQKNKLYQAYQTLINSITPETISVVTLQNIQALDKFDGYTEGVSYALSNADYIFESTLVRLHLGAPIDFHSEKTIEAIKANLKWLLKHSDILMKLRFSVLRVSDEKSVFNYDFLFSEECPILCATEFEKVQYSFSDDAILRLIPASIVTTSEIPMLTSFFNRRFRQNTTTYSYLLYVAKMQQDIAKECFYALNFDYAIKYSTFAAARKGIVKKAFREILRLDSTNEKIRFMEATRFMDSAWEESICDEVKSNSTLQKSYIDAVNHAVDGSITKSTIRCICLIPSFYPLKDTVTKKLYATKNYKHYILCKTLYHDVFILDGPDQIENLWETYMEIFAGSNHPKTRGHMDNSQDLLRLIMEKKAYTGLSVERRNVLAKVHQDADSLQEAINRGESFAAGYYQKIAGFTNEAAAEMFVSIMEGKPNLLRSQAIYDHCHEKLISSTLKAKYTRLRKKHGYM